MTNEASDLPWRLRREILFARERVYRFCAATPLERVVIPGEGPAIWVKREDLSPIKAYKWRGACNRMAVLAKEGCAEVVTASAGNHAQGVALAARVLGINARIYMPRSTPQVKQVAVRYHGGARAEVRLSGDSYDEAVQAARADEASSGATYVHAYDDLQVIAGQGTLADEVVLSGHGPFDEAFLQIGGGGMAAGVSTWLRTYWPEIRLHGVEGAGQASMAAAFAQGEPVDLAEVDLFCDGTAVKRAGSLPFEICRQTLDDLVTVSNAEVSHAIRTLWECHRCISEPSGAMGLAAVLARRSELIGKKVLIVLCGANIDFLQLGHIANSTGAASEVTRTLAVRIPEKAGAMLELLSGCFSGVDLLDFQYGIRDAQSAWPVFTLGAPSATALGEVIERLDAAGREWEPRDDAEDFLFRAIPLEPSLLRCPGFIRLDFYERPGALHDFLSRYVGGRANLVYFNYRKSGERIGRALIGLDFPDATARAEVLEAIPRQHGEGLRRCEVLAADAQARLTHRGAQGNPETW